MYNEQLKKYIEREIFPQYEKNDSGHNIEHINYVIKRSMNFARTVPNINIDIVYTIAAYHDIGHHIDAKNHEKVSADIFRNDKQIINFFTPDEINIIAEAIEDHRASSDEEPRSIYGKIVSSADRNTTIEEPLKRTYAYRIAHDKNSSLDEIIEESRLHIMNKFGKKGYAKEKMYFKDADYEEFLREISALAENKELFREKYLEINNLK